MAVRRRDLTGQRFGRLTVLAFHSVDKSRNVRWACRCDCGVEKVIQKAALVSGSQISCGCAKREHLLSMTTTHGQSVVGSGAYKSWREMHQRCRNRNRPMSRHYCDRGIEIDRRWFDFEEFHADMGERPEGLTLERIDNDGPYSKSNCRWATMAEQNRNKRSNRIAVIDGRSMIVMDWCKERGIPHSRVYNRIHRGMPPSDAVLAG